MAGYKSRKFFLHALQENANERHDMSSHSYGFLSSWLWNGILGYNTKDMHKGISVLCIDSTWKARIVYGLDLSTCRVILEALIQSEKLLLHWLYTY